MSDKLQFVEAFELATSALSDKLKFVGRAGQRGQPSALLQKAGQ